MCAHCFQPVIQSLAICRVTHVRLLDSIAIAGASVRCVELESGDPDRAITLAVDW
jgi:hypothetical protein